MFKLRHTRHLVHTAVSVVASGASGLTVTVAGEQVDAKCGIRPQKPPNTAVLTRSLQGTNADTLVTALSHRVP